jgi:hypothetical protein
MCLGERRATAHMKSLRIIFGKKWKPDVIGGTKSRRLKEGIYALIVSTLQLSCHWFQMIFECIGAG